MGRFLAPVMIAVVVVLNALAGTRRRPPYPRPDRMRLAAEDAVTNVSLLSLGMRRFAADISLIRVIVYYGTPETHAFRERYLAEHGTGREEPGHADREHAGHDHAARGIYPELGPRGLRILDLDPYWTYPVLYVAGALAFNQNRPQEATAVLKEALRYHPKDPKLLAYIGAISFHESGDMAKAVEVLTPAVDVPDSPTMLKHILAFMNHRLGRKEEAVRLYHSVLASRDESYHHLARRALKELGEE